MGKSTKWSDLPLDILSATADYLTRDQSSIHIRSFRSVCHSWRSFFPPLSRLSILSPILPFLIKRPSPPFNSSSPHRHSILSVTLVYVLRPRVFSELLPFSWILFVDEFEPGKLRIHVPFTNDSLILSLCSSKSFNLFDFHVHELGRFYNLCYHGYRYNRLLRVMHTEPQFHSEDVLKVVLFSDGSAAVALFQGGKLVLIKLHLGDNKKKKWKVIHDGKGFRFDDIVDYKGRVLGIDRRGRVYQVSHLPSKSKMKPIARSIADGDGRRNKLVESLGLLYLVIKCNGAGAAFKVYELNEKRRKWVHINSIGDSIGDRVFFFGLDFSSSASARELLFQKNCILFKQHSFRSYKGEADDKAVFCNTPRHGLYVGLCNLNDVPHVHIAENFHGVPQALWPPPAWFWPTNRLERIKTVDATTDELLMRFSKSLEVVCL